MAETQELGIWRFSEKEEYDLAKMFAPKLKNKLLGILGDKKIEDSDLNEYSYYWASSIISPYPVLYLMGITRDSFFSNSDEDKLELLLKEYNKWDRGIEEYEGMAKESLIEIIDDKIKEKGIAKILDIACGEIAFINQIEEKYGKNVECYAVSNEKPTLKNSTTFVNSLAEFLPSAWTNKFDLVTCFEASMYFYDNFRAFNEALRVMAPNGKLFYGEGNLKSLGNKELLERLLNVNDFEYTIPPGFGCSGQHYKGIFAKC